MTGQRRLRCGLACAALWIAALGVALIAGGVASAESIYSFASTPGRLPKNVVPRHYAIDLAPDLDKLTIAGSEVIDVDVLEPTERIVLNAVNMTLDTASLDGEAAAPAISLDAAAETAALTFPHPLAAG